MDTTEDTPAWGNENMNEADVLLAHALDGNATAQYKLGVMYLEGDGVARDLAKAVKWWRKAAEQGDVMAQYLLGVMYNLGLGVTEDEEEAARWFREAAEQGHAEAQFNLEILRFSKGG